MALTGFGALVLATFLQLALPGGVPVLGMEPNLVLALIVAWAWVHGPRWAFVWAVLGGLLLDLSGGGVLGVHALGLLGAAYLVGLLRSLSHSHTWALTIPTGGLGGALYGVVVMGALHLFGGEAVTWQLAVGVIGSAISSGAILSIPFALLFTVLRQGLGQRRAS